MKPLPQLWMVWLLPWGLALLMVIMGLGNQREIERLREERDTLERAASSNNMRARPDGRAGRPRTRERADHRAEGRRIAAELAGRTMAEADRSAGVKLAAEVLAMNSEQLREAIRFLIQADGLERGHRAPPLKYLIGRLAEDHPREALAMLGDIRVEQSELLAFHEIDSLAGIAARQLAGSHPDFVWTWFQQQKNKLEENHATNLRFAVLRGVVRVNPEGALRWAAEEGIDAIGFLAWDHQTPDEKLASLVAVRAWSDDPEVVRKTIRELAQKSPHGGYVSFETVTQWVELAGLTAEDLDFFVDPALPNPRYDPVEIASWLQWLTHKFPPDAVERRVNSNLRPGRSTVGP
jgi:hypothetical protein